MEIVLAICAGFFAGAFLCLSYAHVQQGDKLSKIDAERKRWINKVLVRDGQAKVFPDSEIEPIADGEKNETRTSPMVMRSPLQNGYQKLKDKISSDKKIENGSNLPEAVKVKIVEAANARQSG